MGVSMNQYLFWGVKVAYDCVDSGLKEEFEEFEDSFHDNGYRKEVRSHFGLTLISDGMGGKYRVIGRVLEKADPGYPIKSVFEIPKPTEAEEEMLRALIDLQFAKYIPSVKDAPISVMVITHYH